MDITPAVPADRQIIQSYSDGGFRISQVRHQGAVLVTPQQTWPWPVAGFDAIDADSLAPLHDAAEPVEILLLGCGPTILPVPTALRQSLRERGMVIEPMDTGAACRTYNVLLSEARRVAAALLPVG